MPKRKDPTTPLGARVRSDRLDLRWTQEQLAEKAGKIPRQAVTDMESGPPERKVDIERIFAVARAMDQPPMRYLSLALPGELSGALINPEDLTPLEQEYIDRLRRASPAVRERALSYLRFEEERDREEQPPPGRPAGRAPQSDHTSG